MPRRIVRGASWARALIRHDRCATFPGRWAMGRPWRDPAQCRPAASLRGARPLTSVIFTVLEDRLRISGASWTRRDGIAWRRGRETVSP
jgi:hypothetical protein